MKTKLLLLVLFVLATTCAKGQQPRASGIPVPTVVQHNALSNTLRNFTITATNSIAELTVDATNDLYLLQTANLNGASNVLRTFTIDTATVQTAAINNASNVVYLFTITATNDASQVLRTLILAATNDLNTVLRTLVTAATNGSAATAFTYANSATNALDGVLRTLITAATNNNAATGRIYTDAATNALAGVLRIYTDSATNDLNTVLRAIIASSGQWVSNSTSLWTPLNVGVKTNAPQTAFHIYGTARVEGPSAQVLAPPGSQALPGVSFAGDADTGLWNGISDGVYLIAGGQQIGAFDTTTVYLIKPLSFGIGGNSALLYGDSDGSIGQRSTTKAQSNSLYRTFTDSANYSRLKHGYDTTKTAFFIRTEEAGTGIGNNPIQINAGPYNQVANLNLLTNGNVGIGVPTPLFKLSLNGDIKLTTSGDSSLRFTPPSGGMGIADSAGKMILFNGPGSETRFAILNDGNVGVGTNAPATKLHVYGSIRAEGPSAQILAPPGSMSLPGLSFTSDPATGIYLPSGSLAYIVSGSSVPAGWTPTVFYAFKSLGIGPNSTLLTDDAPNSLAQRNATVAQSNSTYRTFTDANNYSRLKHGYDATKTAFFIRTEEAGTGIGNNPIHINAGPYAQTANLTLSTNGNVGIGTASPGQKLDVIGSIRATGSADAYLILDGTAGGEIILSKAGASKWAFGTDVGAATDDLNFYGYGVSSLSMTLKYSNGFVGINNQNPTNALHVKGSITVETNMYLSKTITAAGTTGAQTINKLSGTVNFAAAASTLVVTCNLADANSIITAQVYGIDATATSVRVTPAAGSFTLTLNAAATLETAVAFRITN